MEILDNLLFSRVMFLVGGMLIFTAIGARINKAYETSFELTATFFAVVLLLILSFSYKDDYPTNLIILAMFSFSMGWNIGPWQNVIFNTMFCTCLAVLSSALLVYFSSIDFGFLGSILFLSLIIFIAVYTLNHFIFKSSTRRTMLSYVGAVIFCFYLVDDFSMLEKAMASGDNSWGKAVVIAVNIYLDIINLIISFVPSKI